MEIIIYEGPDRSGKSSGILALYERLSNEGKIVSQVASFYTDICSKCPDYDKDFFARASHLDVFMKAFAIAGSVDVVVVDRSFISTAVYATIRGHAGLFGLHKELQIICDMANSFDLHDVKVTIMAMNVLKHEQLDRGSEIDSFEQQHFEHIDALFIDQYHRVEYVVDQADFSIDFKVNWENVTLPQKESK